jgi:hypothetical protein
MNIADIIAALASGQNPNQAIMGEAQGALPPSPPPQAGPPGPPPPTAPHGVSTPVTNPQPADQAPMITKSPPDLANMYIALMEKNQNAAQLDSPAESRYLAELHRQQTSAGLSSAGDLAAAAFSKYPENRSALINASQKGGMTFSAQDMINLEKQRTEQQQQLIRARALPALMKQYNMSPAQITHLESSGKLDEVLGALANRSLAHVTDANGQVHLVDDRAEGGKGKIITTIGSEKPDPTQMGKGPQGEQVINMRTGQPVGAPLGPTDANVDAKGTKFPSLDTGYDYARDEKGLVKLTDGVPTVAATPGSKAQQTEIATQQKKVEQKMQASSALSSVATAVTATEKAMDEAIVPGAVGLGSKLYNMTVGQLGGMAGNVIRDNIDTIKANATFDKLAAMRVASPTGGALGSVSDFENKLLGAATATLSPNLNADQLRENMYRVQATMELLANKQYTDEKAFDADVKKRINTLKTERANRSSASSGITVTRE